MALYPQPVAGEFTLYLLGPGFGESVVMRLPEGGTVVVDCCTSGGRCLTLELLQDIGASEVALLILTHPDLDHVAGLNTLLSAFAGRVRRVWRWPHLSLMRDLLARWGASQPSLVELATAFQRLDTLQAQNACLEVTINDRDELIDSTRFSALAPVPADLNASRRFLNGILTRRSGGAGLSAEVQAMLTGGAVNDHPNTVSLAVSVRWGAWKLLLGGDVESHRRGWRGWGGVLQELGRQGRLDDVTDLDVVKLAHHGSENAWSDAAWNLHTRRGPVKAALIAPFSRSDLPREPQLRALKTRADRIGISGGSTAPQILAAAWAARPGLPGASVVVLRLRADGSHDLTAQGDAGVFV